LAIALHSSCLEIQVRDKMSKQKIYFPNLNGLRFIAAFLVIIHHIEQLKSISNITPNWSHIPFIVIIGKLGVVLFFVLSGFLITYLLLTEEYSFKTISVRKFYIRRILRIWPLYFLVVILALFVLPDIHLFTLPGFEKEVIHKNFFLKVFLYAVFFPNLVYAFAIVPYASHTWSIGTEEQFYLVWPVILKYFRKNRLLLMFSIIFIYLSISKILGLPYFDFIPHKITVIKYWSKFNIDCMAIGGIYAILLFQKSRFLKYLLNNYVFYFTIIALIILLAKGVYIPNLHFEFYSVLFGIIILNFAANERIKISLENKVLTYLGNISYGLYMYHPIAIMIALSIAAAINFTSGWLIYPASIALTIALAGMSYKYYESFFLKFKNKFSNILSGK
jgi:peptidoglycan/LPS O-acetylase OafA/YrhL